ncbi:MAG: 3-hydroxyacyl-CoA dehydrogenase NAD-binding domain-containing protein, partial [Acidimicrobiales bacterium]
MIVPGEVGVLGGGRMGAGIAHGFLCAGSRVRLVEVDDRSAAAARQRVEAVLLSSPELAPHY